MLIGGISLYSKVVTLSCKFLRKFVMLLYFARDFANVTVTTYFAAYL